MTTQAACPTCQAPPQDSSTARHCPAPGCTWLHCRCGTTYSAIHPADHYPRNQPHA